MTKKKQSHHFKEEGFEINEEQQKRREIKKSNIEILNELKGKTIEITSNVYKGETRKYKVENIREMIVKTQNGFVPAVRLENDSVAIDLQPTINLPLTEIDKIDEGDEIEIKIVYTRELNIQQSFKHLHKKTEPEMVLFIRYKK